MGKKFNTTGVCIPHLHYMVDLTDKLEQIEKMVHSGDYFVMNRPRQYGKTTTMYMLEQALKDEYCVLSISFEGLGDSAFENELTFVVRLLRILAKAAKYQEPLISQSLLQLQGSVHCLEDLSDAITELSEQSEKPIVLFIDEVDKSADSQLFLNFLGMLRNKFLLRQQGKDQSFHSVILAGVYDIKNLKIKMRQGEEQKYNSPWNIAVQFDVDMRFNPKEIASMLTEYAKDKNNPMPIQEISEALYFYTDGYPFLVSRLCELIDKNLSSNSHFIWDIEIVNWAVKEILQESNTLFDDLIKNVENNTELREYTFDLIINGTEKTFNIDNPIIHTGIIFGYFKTVNGRVRLSNRIFEQRLYNYFSSKLENKTDMSSYNFRDQFILNNGLDFEKILLRFQQFMKEQYSSIDSKFIEREGRLLFLAFIKPIINGIGFDFKEIQISEEKRLDMVITYLSNKYLVELKIWRGPEYHKKGCSQLCDYLNNQGLDRGYLIIYNFNKNKVYKEEHINYEGKELFIVYV